RRLGVRLLHAHDFYSNLVATPLGSVLGLPVIVSRRDLANWLRRRERRALALVCRRADRVLCNASAVAEVALADRVRPERICVSPNGLDVHALHERTRRAE